MSETKYSQHIVQEHPNTRHIQFGLHRRNIHVEPQQPGAVQLRPPHQIIHMEDRIGDIADWDRKISHRIGDIADWDRKISHRIGDIADWDRKISHRIGDIADWDRKISHRIGDIADWDRKISHRIGDIEGAYSKINNTIKFFSSFYGIMQVGILTAVFSSQQRKGLCKDSWGLLLLSAIVSGGVLIAFLWKYCQQFLLLRRGRRLIQERNSVVGHSSGISTVDLKEEDDLDINSNYWSWITERVAIVVTFTIFSIYLWLSCKSRLLC